MRPTSVPHRVRIAELLFRRVSMAHYGLIHACRYEHRRLPGVDRAHARLRALGERANATLKTWKLLTRLRCCPRRATSLLAAILVLQLVEEQRNPG